MRVFSFIALMLFSSNLFSRDYDSGSIIYRSGSSDLGNIQLFTETMKTVYRYVTVPYDERVCRREQRYRRECRTVPGRRICRRTPPRRVCKPGRDGRPICRTTPGREICRREPSRQVCRKVPYYERVCRYERRYRRERRAFSVVDQKTNANVTVSFIESALSRKSAHIEVSSSLNRNILNVNFSDLSGAPGFLMKTEYRESRFGPREDLSISRNYQVQLFNSRKLFAPLRGDIVADDIYGNQLRLKMNKITYPQELKFHLKVYHEERLLVDKYLEDSDYLLELNGNSSEMILLLSRMFNIPQDGELFFEYTVSVDQERYENSSDYNDFDKKIRFSKSL